MRTEGKPMTSEPSKNICKYCGCLFRPSPDNSARNAIEGKFGQCKRRLGLGRVMARRKDSSETVIAITILTANLIRWEQENARILFFFFRQSPGVSILMKITKVTGGRYSRLRFSRLKVKCQSQCHPEERSLRTSAARISPVRSCH